ncbi:MAG TPA: hypothetical protein VFP40_11205 [Terriglobales bacterium]|nr:hypothetical protein [Terriglobales bacterium]
MLFFLEADPRPGVGGFLNPWLDDFLVCGCSASHLSSCLRRFARKLFSLELSFDFAFGRQLPCSCWRFPLTGSYPGQQRLFFFVGIDELEVPVLSVVGNNAVIFVTCFRTG